MLDCTVICPMSSVLHDIDGTYRFKSEFVDYISAHVHGDYFHDAYGEGSRVRFADHDEAVAFAAAFDGHLIDDEEAPVTPVEPSVDAPVDETPTAPVEAPSEAPSAPVADDHADGAE